MLTRARDGAPTRAAPLESEIDVCGLTHPGRVRPTNADQFLIASLHRVLRVQGASFGGADLGPLETDSRGYLFLIADGVGGHEGAAAGSLRAVQAVTQYILHMTELHSKLEPAGVERLLRRLRSSVMRGHEALRASGDPELGDALATTLTMLVAYWPRVYLIHCGDSRCYRLRGGALERLTTDQNMAQAMVEAGAMTPEEASMSQLRHVLWSALGSSEVEPQLLVTDAERSDVWLLCTDGLTRHVADDEIRAHLARDAAAESIAHDLVSLALDRGGEDNVTVIVGRVREV
jgi:protein phosphatase